MYSIDLFTFKGETKEFIPADPSNIASTKLVQHTACATRTTVPPRTCSFCNNHFKLTSEIYKREFLFAEVIFPVF